MNAQERRKWLLSISDKDEITLSMDDWYDRCRYLRELEGMERLKSSGNPPVAGKEKTPPIASGEFVRLKDYWNK